MSEVDEIMGQLSELRERLLLEIVRERQAGVPGGDVAELAYLVANGDGEFTKRGFARLLKQLIEGGRLQQRHSRHHAGSERSRTRPFVLPADDADAGSGTA
jgi:hypothetical protein